MLPDGEEMVVHFVVPESTPGNYIAFVYNYVTRFRKKLLQKY